MFHHVLSTSSITDALGAVRHTTANGISHGESSHDESHLGFSWRVNRRLHAICAISDTFQFVYVFRASRTLIMKTMDVRVKFLISRLEYKNAG